MKQHSPTLYWLLLAATLAVDMVVIAKLLEAGNTSRISYIYDALITGQLAVVCLWGMFSARRAWLAWLAALVAVGIAGSLLSWVADLSFVEGAGIYGSFVALLAAVLWVIKRTPVWQRLVGMSEPSTWQFSLGHLLAAMTVVAMLITALRGSVLLLGSEESWKFLVMLTACDVLLVTTTALVWLWAAWLPHWWPRLGAAIAPALVIGGIEAAITRFGWLGPDAALLQNQTPFDLVAYTLMVSLVIFVYLELTPIIGRGDSQDVLIAEATKT